MSMSRPWRRLDTALERRGFATPIRRILLSSLMVGVLCTLGGLIGWQNNKALLWFGLFVLISTWNFWGLASFINKMISKGWSKNIQFRLFLGFQLRLFLTGIFVYIALVHWYAPLYAVLSGLSVSLVFVVIFGGSLKK